MPTRHFSTKIKVNCKHCNKAFLAYPYSIRNGNGKYCSHSCYSSSLVVPIADKFWKMVEITPYCWIWKGSRHNKYGKVSGVGFNNGMEYSHRVSWKIHYGEINDNLSVLHKCDNTLCVNPEHLFLGTQSDNSKDMWTKGRSKISKFSKSDIVTIRTLRKAGVPCKVVASIFGVHRTSITNITSGVTWSHVH